MFTSRARRLRLPLAGAMAACLALAACGGGTASTASQPAPAAPAAGQPQTPAKPAGQTTLKVAVTRSIAEVPLIFGLDRFAQAHGIKIELVIGTNYADSLRSLSQNAVDVATLGYQNVANLADQGATDVKVVAGGWRTAQNLIARTGSGINGWPDLKGKKIGIVPGSYAAIMFLVAAREHGIDPKGIDITNVSAVGPTVFASMKSGALDGYVIWSPVMEQGIDQGVGYRPKDIDIRDTPDLKDGSGLIAVGPKLLQDGATLSGFLQAYVEGVKYYTDHPDQWVQLAAQVTGADRSALETGVKDGNVLDYKVLKASLLGAAKYGTEFGYTKTDTSSKVESYVDLGPLARVLGVSPQSLWE